MIRDMAATGGGGADVDVWWTPDCGYLHLDRNPMTVPVHCPEGVKPYRSRSWLARLLARLGLR